MRALSAVENSTQWDDMCREATTVERLNDSTSVVYLRLEARKCLVKAGRDFCLVQADATREDGTFLMAGASIEYPRCPPRQDTVRGEIKCGGWIVKPIDNGRASHITYVVQVDLRGGVPGQLLDKIAMRVPLAIHYLGTWIKSRGERRR